MFQSLCSVLSMIVKTGPLQTCLDGFDSLEETLPRHNDLNTGGIK